MMKYDGLCVVWPSKLDMMDDDECGYCYWLQLVDCVHAVLPVSKSKTRFQSCKRHRSWQLDGMFAKRMTWMVRNAVLYATQRFVTSCRRHFILMLLIDRSTFFSPPETAHNRKTSQHNRMIHNFPIWRVNWIESNPIESKRSLWRRLVVAGGCVRKACSKC